MLDPQPRHLEWIASARRQASEMTRADPPDAGSSNPPARAFGPSSRLAPDPPAGYCLLRELQRGGQGVVFEARQASTGRLVALKFIRHGLAASPTERARFDREADILARLDHPDIVGIIDRGTAPAGDFFVMDFVDGRTIDRWVREERPRLDQRLALFVRIADAVNAAHLRGVIHRDLKPGNILIVDGADRAHGDARPEPAPRILDFGLAKWNEAAPPAQVATEAGQFVGSLPWAAPEQVTDEAIDLRTDVYALGLILYFLLTGGFPYRVVGPVRDVIDDILTREPAPPSRHARIGLASIVPPPDDPLDADLNAIALRALAKDPAHRYQTAGEFARDLRRFLSGEAIDARRHSTRYVLSRLVRRHRAAVSTAAVLATVVAVGLVVSLSLWRLAAQQRDRAVLAEREQRREQQIAHAEASKARAVNEFLRRMLASASPEASAGRPVDLAAVVGAAAAELEAGALRKQPDVESTVRTTLGEVYLTLGRNEPAEAQLTAALEIRERIASPHDAETGRILDLLGRVHAERSDWKRAESFARRAVDVARALAPEGSDELSRALYSLARVQRETGRTDEALTTLRSVLDLRRQLHGDAHADVAATKACLAAWLHEPGASISLMLEAVATYRDTLGPEHPRTLLALQTLGGLHHMARDVDAAELA